MASATNAGPTVELIDPGADHRSQTRWASEVNALFHAALPVAQRDDRFDQWLPPADLVGALARVDDHPVGYLGGTVSRGRLQLDALVAPAAHDRDQDDEGGERIIDADQAAAVVVSLFTALDDAGRIPASGASTVELWGRPERPWHAIAAEVLGMSELRALHQLRCPLPVADQPLASRPFIPGVDEAALVRVNNRAFATHPDQGDMTVDDLLAAASEPWFDPDGIRLHDAPDGAGLAGFCWTKIHRSLGPGQPDLGEIYAIGIDPDHHGKGLGRPMTAAGLHWLAGKGLRTGMLYVEADNEPALRTYHRLGFEHHRTDRAWHRPM